MLDGDSIPVCRSRKRKGETNLKLEGSERRIVGGGEETLQEVRQKLGNWENAEITRFFLVGGLRLGVTVFARKREC